MGIKVSVLVPTLGNRPAELERLFHSLERQQYDELEVIVVAQGNYEAVKRVCDNFLGKINIVFLTTEKKGLSRARNIGNAVVTGDVILLSDDDCWYEKDSVRKIADYFHNNSDVDILLTQIYAPNVDGAYKMYSSVPNRIKSPFELLSRSSIEIAYKNNEPRIKFDELFGLGARYVAGEEVDFLLRSYKSAKTICYEPMTTVYHDKKMSKESNSQIVAKGALYSKNFGFVVANLVLLRDLLLKHQNNFRWFWHGYFDYKK